MWAGSVGLSDPVVARLSLSFFFFLQVDKTVKQLVADFRQMAMPHTADHLKERR